MHGRSEVEAKIIRMLGRGLETAEIATKMGKAPRTIEWAIGVLKQRYNANNRTELVVIAIKEGIVDLDEL